MKAIILGAGYAVRLHPLTLNQPKPLLQISSKPILERLIEKILKINFVKDIFLVTNQKFFSHYINWQKKSSLAKNLKIINDGTTSAENRLGAIGDIKYVIDLAKINEETLIIAGDNLFEFNLKKIYQFYKDYGPTIVLKNLKSLNLVSKYSNVEINSSGKIINFIEKPKNPKTTLIALGIYFFNSNVLKFLSRYLKERNNPDAPGYFIEWLHKKTPVCGYIAKGKWYDIGDFDSYQKANRYYKKRALRIKK
ncbi:MAG: nucleotidyltransferase family protein [Armatimonadetes bacterium]|nr:nucleotidyltransferase family protein [Armatimonadota bacterium]